MQESYYQKYQIIKPINISNAKEPTLKDCTLCPLCSDFKRTEFVDSTFVTDVIL